MIFKLLVSIQCKSIELATLVQWKSCSTDGNKFYLQNMKNNIASNFTLKHMNTEHINPTEEHIYNYIVCNTRIRNTIVLCKIYFVHVYFLRHDLFELRVWEDISFNFTSCFYKIYQCHLLFHHWFNAIKSAKLSSLITMVLEGRLMS